MRPIATTPRYAEIADDLRRQILDGTLAPGARLPTLAELTNRYNVSERTAYEATRLLLNEGLINSKTGSGSFVRGRPTVVRLARSWYRDSAGRGSPWRADMAAQGRDGSWISHSTPVKAAPAIAERLAIEPGDRAMRTEYTFTADGAPTYLSTSWEPLALTNGTEIMLPEDGEYAGAGVVDRFAAIGITIDRNEEEILAHNLTIAEAEKLRLRPGISAVMIQRTYFAGDTPVETAAIVLPPHYRAVYQIPVG